MARRVTFSAALRWLVEYDDSTQVDERAVERSGAVAMAALCFDRSTSSIAEAIVAARRLKADRDPVFRLAVARRTKKKATAPTSDRRRAAAPRPTKPTKPLTEGQKLVLKAAQALTKKLKRPPTVSEIAKRMGVNPAAVGNSAYGLSKRGYAKVDHAKRGVVVKLVNAGT